MPMQTSKSQPAVWSFIQDIFTTFSPYREAAGTVYTVLVLLVGIPYPQGHATMVDLSIYGYISIDR